MTAKPKIEWRLRPFLSVADTAALLGVSQARLYQARRAGQLTFKNVLGKVVVPTEDIARLVDEAAEHTPSPERGAAARASRLQRASCA